jgi:hypothetical protein
MRRHFVMAVVFAGVFSAVVVSQWHVEADAAQNYNNGTPKSADAARKQTSPKPSWDVRYKSGSFKLKEGQWLKSAFVPIEIVHKIAPSATDSTDQLREVPGPSVPILTVTSDQLRGAYFDARAEKDSDLMQRMPRSGCHYAETMMPKNNASSSPQAFAAWKASPGGFSRALERLNRRHSVRLMWTDGATDSEVVLMVNDCEYASFLANLRLFAGPRWQEIGHELQK